MIVWFNGKLVQEQDARVSIHDKGFLVGDGVFETLRSYQGMPFALREHFERLSYSAEKSAMCIDHPEQLEAAVWAVLEANALQDARIRITVTSGDGPAGLNRGSSAQTQLISATALQSWPASATACISPWPKNEHGPLAGVKSISNAENTVKLAYAKKHGVDELISFNTAGNLCEGTTSNVLVVDDRGITTPPLTAGCLAGVTRAYLIRFARAQGIEIQEINSTKNQLLAANEILLSSSTRIIQPVVELNGNPVGTGTIGQTAQQLTTVFADGVKRMLKR